MCGDRVNCHVLRSRFCRAVVVLSSVDNASRRKRNPHVFKKTKNEFAPLCAYGQYILHPARPGVGWRAPRAGMADVGALAEIKADNKRKQPDGMGSVADFIEILNATVGKHFRCCICLRSVVASFLSSPVEHNAHNSRLRHGQHSLSSASVLIVIALHQWPAGMLDLGTCTLYLCCFRSGIEGSTSAHSRQCLAVLALMLFKFALLDTNDTRSLRYLQLLREAAVVQRCCSSITCSVRRFQ